MHARARRDPLARVETAIQRGDGDLEARARAVRTAHLHGASQRHSEAATRCNQRLSEALRGTQRHSEALRGTRRHSEALGGTRRHSEALGGTHR